MTIWSSSPGTVQVGVCVSVIAVASILHSPNCLYSDDKFCGLPTKKPSENSSLVGRNDQLFKRLLLSKIRGGLRTGLDLVSRRPLGRPGKKFQRWGRRENQVPEENGRRAVDKSKQSQTS